MVAERENSALSKQLFAEAVTRYEIAPGSIAVRIPGARRTNSQNVAKHGRWLAWMFDVAVDLVVFVALDGDVDVDPTVVDDDDGQGKASSASRQPA